MAEPKAAAKAWTDAEKVGLFFQIIERAGPIPWPDLTLPEGRTLKACQVMVDKEKQKIKKAREAAGEPPLEATPKAKGKRKAEGDAETPVSSAKKPKGRKKKAEEENKDDAEDAKDEGAGETLVKAEVDDEVEA